MELCGRRPLLRTVADLISRRRSVLLVGGAGIGKSALVNALRCDELLIVDPFEHISTQRAWRIRRAMDGGMVCLAAARTLDRATLGAVGRIAWRFETVRVPPLASAWIRRLVVQECCRTGIDRLVTPEWATDAVALAAGRPGIALNVVQAAARLHNHGAPVVAVASAYLASSMECRG